MATNKKIPPERQSQKSSPRSLLELDRFSSASLKAWQALSADLDELEQSLYFALEPERRRLMPEMLAALQGQSCKPMRIRSWVRMLSYTYSRQPLSAAGSLLAYGGRFNAGSGLDEGAPSPWPCLYLAENFETAFRERFQLASTEELSGLSPQELALRPNSSLVTVQVSGQVQQVFDMTNATCFDGLAAVLGKITMPDRARALQKKLQIPATQLFMMRKGAQFWDAAVKQNWRVQPVQFGLPSQSQLLADLIRRAGYEAILYPSSKASGQCLAVFPENLLAGSLIKLDDKPPTDDTETVLDSVTSATLAGWEILPAQSKTTRS